MLVCVRVCLCACACTCRSTFLLYHSLAGKERGACMCVCVCVCRRAHALVCSCGTCQWLVGAVVGKGTGINGGPVFVLSLIFRVAHTHKPNITKLFTRHTARVRARSVEEREMTEAWRGRTGKDETVQSAAVRVHSVPCTPPRAHRCTCDSGFGARTRPALSPSTGGGGVSCPGVLPSRSDCALCLWVRALPPPPSPLPLGFMCLPLPPNSSLAFPCFPSPSSTVRVPFLSLCQSQVCE